MMETTEQRLAASMPDESINGWHLQFVDNFGVWHLTITEAAELIALDMWFSGDLPDIEEPEDWDGSERDPRIIALLQGHIETFRGRLLAAVDSGRLKAATLRRDFDEQLIPSDTYISYGDLDGWLLERGYTTGDIFGDWSHSEMDIAETVADHAAYLREAKKAGTLREALLGDPDAAAKAAIEKIRSLKEQLANQRLDKPAKVDRPLSTRQRRTLLTIIAAFCEHEKLGPQGRGTAQRIREMTEGIGAPIDDGTIANLLAEIPDALETRMK